MVRRANLHSGANRKKRVYSSKYALSSIVYCPKCGDIYRRIAWNNRGKHSIVRRCASRVEHGPGCCDAPTVQEAELQDAVMQAINTAFHSRDTVPEQFQQNIDAVLSEAEQPADDNVDSRLERPGCRVFCSGSMILKGKKDYGCKRNFYVPISGWYR